MMRSRLAFCLVAASLAGCAEVPELDARVTPAARTAPYPTLQPLDPLLTDGAAGETDEATAEALLARAAALQARANRMR